MRKSVMELWSRSRRIIESLKDCLIAYPPLMLGLLVSIALLGIIWTNMPWVNAMPESSVVATKALIGVLAVLIAWGYQINISAKRGAIDLAIHAQLGNAEWVKGVQELADATEGLKVPLKAPFPDRIQNHEVLTISFYLHHCELVAVAIKKGVVDKRTYMLYNRTLYVRTWQLVRKYIEAERGKDGQNTAFENFEHLARSWSTEGTSETTAEQKG